MGVVLETWAREFRQSVRALARAPVFAVVTIVTLALAIGANAAIFSVVRAVLLEPLPFPNADRLVEIAGTAPGTDQPEEFGVSDELYFEYLDRVPAIEDAGLYTTGSSTTRAEGNTEQLFLTGATPSVFTTLGAQPQLGRMPTDDDGEDVAVISDWLWQSWFGSDPEVIGRSYDFAGETRTVIGVMPPEFRFPDERVAFWIPLQRPRAEVQPGGFGTRMVARLAPGSDPTLLASLLQPLAMSVQERLGGPAPYVQIMEHHRPVVRSLREQLVGRVATPLWIMMGAVGIVFLIACANVANLFTVRAESRRRDLAVRRALGAGRASLVRAPMMEALLLAAAGGIGGILIAWAGVPLLVRMAPDAVGGGFGSAPIPGLATAGLDLTTLLFAVIVSIVAACFFGLLPAIRFSGTPLATLRGTGRSLVGRGGLIRDGLVVVQTASALVLLVGSALLVRSFWQLTRVDPGFDTEDIFTFQIAPDRPDLTDRASVSRFQYVFMDRLEALPGVESVGYVTTLPLDEGAGDGFVTTPRILASGAEAPRVRVAGAGGGYFPTMGIDLLRGRFFERLEEEQGVQNVIISRSAAELLYPGDDPLGQQLRPVGGDESWYNVIGVVDDVLLDDIRRETPEPMVYLPAVSLSPAYVVKSPRADLLAPEVRELIREMIPESPMYRVFTMERLAANSMASLSFTMLMLVIAAILALVLGAVGIYGTLAYVVTQRTREIAVRMALGAKSPGIRRMVVFQGGRVAAVGIVVGLVVALAATRLLGSLLFDVPPVDAFSFVVMPGIMLAIALLASYVPARRASAVDPMRSLRAE